jgi:PilZ domain
MGTNITKDSNERREKQRFPIQRELRFRLLQEGRVAEAGQGQTLNLSSGGVAFSLPGELPVGAFIELSISWPVQLETGTPMRLVVFGRVLRSSEGEAACTVDKYEFRTQARSVPVTAGKAASDPVPRRWTIDIPTRNNFKGSVAQTFTLSAYRGDVSFAERALRRR